MSIVIALILVVVVAGLVAKFYPKQQSPTLAQGETLTPDPVVTEESVPEVVVEPLVETKVETEETPTMVAKPKKKPQPKKKTPKAKTNA